jgi:hypothetical protein
VRCARFRRAVRCRIWCRQVNRRTRQSGGVEDDEIQRLLALMQPIDQRSFVIGLNGLDRESESFPVRSTVLGDVVEGRVAVFLRPPLPESVEVGAVHDCGAHRGSFHVGVSWFVAWAGIEPAGVVE